MYALVNASYGNAISIDTLVKKVVSISKRDLKISYDKTKPTIKTKIAISNSLAKNVFNWEPSHSLEAGIQKTIQWYKDNIAK